MAKVAKVLLVSCFLIGIARPSIAAFCFQLRSAAAAAFVELWTILLVHGEATLLLTWVSTVCLSMMPHRTPVVFQGCRGRSRTEWEQTQG